VTTVAATASGLQTVTITITPTGPRAIAPRSRSVIRAASGAATSPFS
jgi:hypothetical protein